MINKTKANYVCLTHRTWIEVEVQGRTIKVERVPWKGDAVYLPNVGLEINRRLQRVILLSEEREPIFYAASLRMSPKGPSYPAGGSEYYQNGTFWIPKIRETTGRLLPNFEEGTLEHDACEALKFLSKNRFKI